MSTYVRELRFEFVRKSVVGLPPIGVNSNDFTPEKPTDTVSQWSDFGDRLTVSGHNYFLTSLSPAKQIGQSALRIGSGHGGGHGVRITSLYIRVKVQTPGARK
jgi:hypothetical protein